MPPRRRSHWFFHPSRLLGFALLALIGLAAVGYVWIAAWLQSRGEPFLSVGDLIPTRLSEVTMVLWLAFMGASIGSFLNVVAWRMPRGQTISGRSFCPRCQTRLQARDNFPVFGWLFLAGRCRTCRLPISARYPIVEALVGTSIAMVGVAELYRLALPFQERAPSWGPLSTPAFYGSMLLTGLYHIVALSVAWGFNRKGLGSFRSAERSKSRTFIVCERETLGSECKYLARRARYFICRLLLALSLVLVGAKLPLRI